MNDDNKPCPFCGSDNVKLRGFMGRLYIQCSGCHIEGPSVPDNEKYGEPAAWRKWNTRPTQPNSDIDNMVAIQCSDGNWNYDPYMHGMANGLLLAQATINGAEYEPLNAPVKWLSSDAEVAL